MRPLRIALFILLDILLLGLASVVNAQDVSVRYQGQAISNRGLPLANQNVAICTQPAVTTTQPCSPLAILATSTSTNSGGANPTTTDVNGNFFFYAVPGKYTVQIYGPQISSQFVQPDTILACAPTGNCTVAGAVNAKSIENIQFADQFAATTIAAPVNAPGILNTATGGSVAANTYGCEVTFNGGTTGETTASPASSTTVTSGATSTLFCAPNDASTSGGAASYNVYWQTGGAGSYWKGHASVAFGTMDSQTTTPATSGSNPPGSNTATSIIAGASAAAGTPGVYVIPSGVASGAGSPGDPTAPATVFDYRNGSLNLRATTPPAYMTESGATMNNVLNIVAQPAALGTRQQVNGIQSSVYLGTPTWGNTLPASFGNAAFHGCYRFGTRTEGCGAHTDVIYVANLNATAEGQEIDSNNASGSDAGSSGPTGLNVFDVGANRSWIGVNVAPQGAGHGFVSTAFNSGDGNTPAGLTIGATCASLTNGLCGNSSPAQAINLVSVSSGGTRQTFSITEDAFGNALLEPVSGNLVMQAGASQVANLKFGANTSLRSYTFPDSSQNIASTVVLHSAYTNATTTFSTLSDGTRSASFTAATNTDYTVSCKLLYQGSVTTAGPKVQVTGPASPTAVMLAVDGSTGATAFADAGATAFSSPVTAFGTLGAATTNFTLHIEVGVSNGANSGTVAVQLAANGAGTLTVQPGSYCRIQ